MHFLRRIAVSAASLIASSAAAGAADTPADLEPGRPVEARIDDLLARLTLEEKIALIHGDSKFTTAAIPRLGIPRRWLSDGPHGVREETGPYTWLPAGRTDDFATAMPALIALAATWDPGLARTYGEVIGREARRRGKQILLGPGVNIQRTPLGGRNFEFMGEDPWLVSRLAVADIEGIQSQGVAACVKHFAANNQEEGRMTVDVEMDERTLREIYLPAFKAAVREAGVLAVMGAYNQFRGEHCCENDYLLNRVLKGEWGFQGLVVSDWNGTHDTREAVLHGLDLEMGTDQPYDDFYLAEPFRKGLLRGDYPLSVLDDKVRRNLRVMFATHVFDPGPHSNEPVPALNATEHQAAAERVAEASMVLLKNDGLLPLAAARIRSIAVIGENAVRLQCHDGGSSRIKAFYEVTPLDGILLRAGPAVNVTFSPGYAAYEGAFYLMGPKGWRQAPAEIEAARRQRDDALIAHAVEAARAADIAIIVGGLNHERNFDAEASDRADLKLPFAQDRLIRAVIAANPRTVVVLVSGGAVEMDGWLDRAPAVLQAWYGGMEAGNALARVLFGDVSPSGKLPCTFPKRLADSPAHALGAYPGKDGKEPYAEGLLVGYRWFDAWGIEPLFPFGFGLSYTRFEYSGMRVVPGGVEFAIANVGARAGAETAQVYVRPLRPSVERPVKELKGFLKIFLQPGEKRTVSIPLGPGAYAFYDPARAAWVAEEGDYILMAGSSSRDIRLEGRVRLEQTTTGRDLQN